MYSTWFLLDRIIQSKVKVINKGSHLCLHISVTVWINSYWLACCALAHLHTSSEISLLLLGLHCQTPSRALGVGLVLFRHAWLDTRWGQLCPRVMVDGGMFNPQPVYHPFATWSWNLWFKSLIKVCGHRFHKHQRLLFFFPNLCINNKTKYFCFNGLEDLNLNRCRGADDQRFKGCTFAQPLEITTDFG